MKLGRLIIRFRNNTILEIAEYTVLLSDHTQWNNKFIFVEEEKTIFFESCSVNNFLETERLSETYQHSILLLFDDEAHDNATYKLTIQKNRFLHAVFGNLYNFIYYIDHIQICSLQDHTEDVKELVTLRHINFEEAENYYRNYY